MKAFHNDSKIKAKYLNRVKQHRLADNLVQGQGWEGGKGCAVGCTLEAYDHNRYEAELGIPEWLARVEDTIFEGLDSKTAQLWPERFLKAIKPGVDLNKIEHKFIIFILKSTLKNFDNKKYPDIVTSINNIISLHKKDEPDTSPAWSAARSAAESAARSAAESAAESAAWSAARSAAWSAAWSAAESAAWSAAESAARSAAWSAAYEMYADELLRLIKAL